MSQPLFLAWDKVGNMSPCSPGSNIPVDETVKQMQKNKDQTLNKIISSNLKCYEKN